MSNKIALVTGASSGIGESTARHLHDAGFVVYGAARRADRMASLAAAGIHTVAFDVTDESSAAVISDGEVTVLPPVPEPVRLRCRAAFDGLGS